MFYTDDLKKYRGENNHFMNWVCLFIRFTWTNEYALIRSYFIGIGYTEYTNEGRVSPVKRQTKMYDDNKAYLIIFSWNKNETLSAHNRERTHA